MKRYIVSVAPASEPLVLADVKNHLKVDYSTDDALITSLIVAAREYAENYTNRKFITQTIEEKFNAFPDVRWLNLSVPEVQSITSVLYLDADEVEQTFTSDDYVFTSHQWPAYILLKLNKSWPSVLNRRDVITVTYVVGYGAASDVPDAIKSAMLLIIGDLYEKRTDSVKKLPTAAQHLLSQYRVGL